MNNNFEKPDVQHFISYLEGIINRMASNSASCKNWLLAILVILFCVLDAYYIGCEKYFRNIMGEFVKKVRLDGSQYVSGLYEFEKRSVWDDIKSVFRGFFSIATWPFYGTIIVLVFLIDKGIISLV